MLDRSPPARWSASNGDDATMTTCDRRTLQTARRIVACGAGVRTEDDFSLVRALADALGACLAGTRPAVDRGWISPDLMIGQTGLNVRPEIYVAIGISGASQHRTGIAGSGTIIAINADPQAPRQDRRGGDRADRVRDRRDRQRAQRRRLRDLHARHPKALKLLGEGGYMGLTLPYKYGGRTART
jgi:hypothetical protein